MTCESNTPQRLAYFSKRQRDGRKDPIKRLKFLLIDIRKWDRHHGFVCDLTLESLTTLTAMPCAYCEGTEELRGLDRMDNSFGHTVGNVIACCRRCNYVRRDMPYEAWIFLVPRIRAAFEQGLFANWHPGPHKRS